MRRLPSFVLALLALAAVSLTPALADKRVALVIGNAAYVRVGKLDNPVIDARSMRDALSRLGFTIIYGENLDKSAMERRVADFAGTVGDADVAIVYYAGHGSTFGDIPYVVPIDAEYEKLERIPYELIQVETLVGELRRAKGVRIAILDACRDNEREIELKRTTTRGGSPTRGLARVKNAEGLIVAYATQYLTTAADGIRGSNSPFTGSLVRHLPTPGLDVKAMFFKVAQDVIQKSNGGQRPEISFSLYDDFVLVSAAPTPPALPVPLPPPSPAADEIAWGFLKQTTDIASLRRFITEFPSSVHTGEAEARIATLEREVAEAQRKAEEERKKLAVVAPAVPPAPPPPPVRPAVGVFPGVTPLPPERALKPKDTFKECDTCPEMVVVPSGSFTMGSPASEKQRNSDEGPQRRVTFARQFAVGKFAVTFDEWDACVRDGGCRGHRPKDEGWGRGKRPVINVNWDDAKAYVAWLSRKTGQTYRLLAEAEREYVARADSTTPFWWGATISTGQANYNGNATYGGGRKGELRQRTLPVDSFQPNPWGLYQVHGNVWEWTEDCYKDTYTGAPTDGSVWKAGDCGAPVLRGGSWFDDPWHLRSAYRSSGYTSSRVSSFGFRVARTLTP